MENEQREWRTKKESGERRKGVENKRLENEERTENEEREWRTKKESGERRTGVENKRLENEE